MWNIFKSKKKKAAEAERVENPVETNQSADGGAINIEDEDLPFCQADESISGQSVEAETELDDMPTEIGDYPEQELFESAMPESSSSDEFFGEYPDELSADDSHAVDSFNEMLNSQPAAGAADITLKNELEGIENAAFNAAGNDEAAIQPEAAASQEYIGGAESADTSAQPAEAESVEAESDKKRGLFSKLKDGLKKTRDNLFGGLFVGGEERLDDEFFDELEEAMVISDMGMATTEKLLSALRARLKAEGVHKRSEARVVMIELLAESMRTETAFTPDSEPSVILIVGVNGVGKTTSIGKLASMYKSSGRSVMLAAGDTFRAAAAEQLTIWSERAGVPIVKHAEGADPAAVVFDAIASYKAKKCDLLICDTAGRLHNKKNLMSELAKIRRVIERELPSVNIEVLLVLDATTGQNAIAQAKAFGENTGLTGIILTKLDGTAKGGVVVAVKDELQLPVRFIGVGEGIDDLQPFDADAFARALFAN